MIDFQASGLWSGVEPRCDEFSRTAKITFSVIAIVMVMIVTMSIACVLKAKTIKVLLFIKCNWSFGRRLEIHGRDHDVFVVYHHDGPDVDLVLQELLPLLDQYDITAATEDCFELGTFFVHQVLYTTSSDKTNTTSRFPCIKIQGCHAPINTKFPVFSLCSCHFPCVFLLTKNKIVEFCK